MPNRKPAAANPIARLVIDTPLPHLDKPFDYVVPAELDDLVQPGCRVRVRFAGQLRDAFVLQRAAETEHSGRLTWITHAVSAEPVLTPEIARLARAVADRWAGTLSDVLRLAIPPRHAATEKRPADSMPSRPPAANLAGWDPYPSAQFWLSAVQQGRPARAVWNASPQEDWPARLAEAAHAAWHAGHGALIVVPDHRDLTRLDLALQSSLGPKQHVTLTADLGPAERYRRWLAVSRGTVRIVAGTRAAAFAPVHDLGLVAMWDDGDDLYAEPRAPYAHTRDVLVLRAHLAGLACVIGGFARTAEAQLLVETGWAHDIVGARHEVRTRSARIRATGSDVEIARDPAARSARLTDLTWRTARAALDRDAPVLVQVPRRGYAPVMACARCRQPARCTRCQGPLATGSSTATPACRWCAKSATGWQCITCGSGQLRAVIVGAARTAEELGRAFPHTPVRISVGDSVLDRVPPGRSVVVATPGAEPFVEGGYGAALLLDGWALLTRPDLRAGEETLRRWINAAALVRPASAGGQVVVNADASLAVVQALTRWDPVGYATRELAERDALSFPPTVRMASLTGTPGALADFVSSAQLPDNAETLGPVDISGYGVGVPRKSRTEPKVERLLIRVQRSAGAQLAMALREAAAVRASRKAAEVVRVQLDPVDLM